MRVDDLPTPCLLVERSRLERNLDRMQAHAEAHGVALRPHLKTHKSTALAAEQRRRGALGLTCAKPSEAEVFVAAGFDDLTIAYPLVGEDKLAAVSWLRSTGARVSFCVESESGVRAAAEHFARRGLRTPVLLEVDVGYGRTGVPWDGDEAVGLARAIRDSSSLELRGLLTHAGHSYDGPREGEEREAALRRVADEERDRLLALAVRLREAGLVDERGLWLSVGSTPTARRFRQREEEGFRIDELRPGNYVFHDLTQVALGACDLDDCALGVLTTVVSRRRDERGERAVLDAGKKVFTSDRRFGSDGHGQVVSSEGGRLRPVEGARLEALSEEHGWLRLPDSSPVAVGDRLRVVPNHACVSVATQDRLWVVDGAEVVAEWTVDARGRVV